MSQYKQLSYIAKAMTAGLLTTGVLFSATTQAAVSQAPLSLTEGVAPNMIFTLDDSTSMNWGYTPDAIAGARHERKGKSAYYNPNYYDPNVQYKAPTSFISGIERPLTTSFSKAYYDGFQPNKNRGADWADLRSSYNVTWTYNRSKDGNGSSYTSDDSAARTSVWGKNPKPDFSCTIDFGNTNSGTRDCTTDAGIKISITRTSRTSCTASSPSLPGSGSCSRSSNRLTGSWEEKPVHAYYYIYDNTVPGCNNKSDEACYRLKFVDSQEEKNFATWYSFYRTRALATISAASLAFYDLSPSIRLTWQSLIHCKNLNYAGTSTVLGYRCGINNFRAYSSTHRENFFSWLQSGTRFDQADGTPLRWATKRAGDFLKDSEIAWYKNPEKNDAASKVKYSCRPSYHVLMTDGMWTDTNEPNSVKNFENSDYLEKSLSDGKTYDVKPPFSDSYSGSLADIAMYYWATDLSSMDNNVPPYTPYKNSNIDIEYWDPRNNPATWQHMSNFIMGLGLTEALNKSNIPWSGSTHEGIGYQKLISGNANWPQVRSGGSDNVYDLWHAAINSRGEFFSVDSPDAMVQAFNNILTRIASRKSTAAAPATSNSLEADGDPDEPQNRLVTYSYQSSFDNTEDWVGDLKKVKTYRIWVPDGEGGGSFEISSEDVWSASSKLKNERTVYMAGSNGLQEFTTTNANSKLKSWLNINPETGVDDNRWDDRLNYIRGVRSNEGEGSTSFRKRSSLLGDLLASQPAVVQRPQYLELFSNRLEGNAQYTTFIDTTKNRAGRIYIGGNDGMLHGFDTNSGTETFAFIPTAVFPNLNKLTGKNYTHHYYVDGSPEVADVYDSVAGVWKTILVGTLRAGGKGLFALDVTNPEEVKLLWEFDEFNYTGNDGYRNGMVGPGYSFPKPSIARLHNGKWAVVTGNGYEGANTNNGKAALYVIDAITGKLEKALEVQSATTTPNGLSTPRLADFDSDGVADYAYAGDLHGNLWRFDLLGTGASPDRDLTTGPIYGNKNSTSTDGFKLAYGNSPMFTASSGTHSQPITAAPSLTRHPSGNGYLVIFGTGKYFEDADKTGTETHPQTLYAIWDQKTRAETTGAGMSIDRDALVGQTITATNLIAEGKSSGLERIARTLSDNAVSYYDTNGNVSKQGWYLDLAANSSYEGEMMIENMRVLGRDTLLISTLVPNDDPCAHGAGNWLYALNPATGGRTTHHAFDTRIQNPNGSVTLVSAIKLGNEGGLSLGQDELGITAFGEKIDLGNSGRLRGNRAGSWRFIPNP